MTFVTYIYNDLCDTYIMTFVTHIYNDLCISPWDFNYLTESLDNFLGANNRASFSVFRVNLVMYVN